MWGKCIYGRACNKLVFTYIISIISQQYNRIDNWSIIGRVLTAVIFCEKWSIDLPYMHLILLFLY